MNIARFKDKNFHLERIPLAVFIKRSGQKWSHKIYIMLSSKLSKKEISKQTEKEHHEVKGNVEKEHNKKQHFDRQDGEELGRNEVHIAFFPVQTLKATQ